MKAETREWLVVWGQSVFMALMGLLGAAFIIWAAIS